MYYTREVKGEKPDSHYNPGRILHVLNHMPFLDPRNLPPLRDLMATDPGKRAVADLAAALVAQLKYKDILLPEKVLLPASEFFHQSIMARGYTFEPEPGVLQAAVTSQSVVILVAGAQAPLTSHSRVDACIRVLKDLSPESSTVVFSGGHPDWAAGVHQVDEAAEMIGYFSLRRRTDPAFPSDLQFVVHRESDAKDTIGNLRNAFTEIGYPEHLIVISSLFHLPRFIGHTEALVAGTAVSRLTFVSAEETYTAVEPFMLDHRYIKSCMFEMFSAFVSGMALDELHRPSVHLG